MTEKEMKWHKRFLDKAKEFSEWSKDRSTKVGAVIVRDRNILATGFNGFPAGIPDDVDKYHERPRKYFYVEHAERNAIYQAVKHHSDIRNATIYITHFPCADCARAIVATGITNVVIPGQNSLNWSEKWVDSFEAAGEILEYSSVSITTIAELKINHNCGAQGYNPMLGDSCDACNIRNK